MRESRFLSRALTGVLFLAAVATAPVVRAAETFELGSVGGASPLMWPIYIATAKGMFAAEEIKVDVVFVPSSAALQQQLAAGSLKVGVNCGLVDPIRAINQGAPVAIVRIEGQVPPYALLAKPAIKSIKELNGKTIIVGGAKDITRTYLDRMMSPSGIKPGEYDLVYAGATSARFAALQSGAADAAILFPPFNFHAEAGGFNSLGLVVDYAKNLPFMGTTVNRQWATDNKQRLQKYLAAFTKAALWFNDQSNREEAIKILVDVTHGARDDIEKSYDFYRKINFFETTGKVSKAKIGEIVKVLKDGGDIDQKFDVDRLFMPGVTEISE
jgi:ABC-type nitrate/sulfonate/bicarbonate transport system substrate-binding protein